MDINPLLARPAGEPNRLLGPTNVTLLRSPLARSVTSDEYLQGILAREAVDASPYSAVRSVQATLRPVLSAWANRYLYGISPSGSFAKGTANSSGTSIDLVILLADDTPAALKQLYDRLSAWMQQAGYTPKRRNVSVNINVAGYDVDLIPARLSTLPHAGLSLYRRRSDTWTRTNLVTHVNHIASSGRLSEIRLLKLWRNQKRLVLPSFYLEMTILAALQRHHRSGALAENMLCVLTYLRDRFVDARVTDPANPDNVISDDLTAAEKRSIRAAATQALSTESWQNIVI